MSSPTANVWNRTPLFSSLTVFTIFRSAASPISQSVIRTQHLSVPSSRSRSSNVSVMAPARSVVTADDTDRAGGCSWASPSAGQGGGLCDS